MPVAFNRPLERWEISPPHTANLGALLADLMDEIGLMRSLRIIFSSLLEAKETKFVPDRGRLKEKTVQALGIRHTALDTAFKLRGSWAPRNPKEAEQFGIKVVVVDIPRPPRNAIDVTPPETGGNGKPLSDNNGHD